MNSFDMQKLTRGFVYVAWGEQFVREAIQSLSSLREHMQYPAILITSEAPSVPHSFDKIIVCAFKRTYRDKIMMRFSDFDESIFIDTDTKVMGSFEPVFELLQRFDIAYQPSAPSDHYNIPGLPMHAFDEPSAGLIAWRRNAETNHFFDLWDNAYSCEEDANGQGAWDQRSMRAALWNSNVRIAPLSRDWQTYSFEVGVVHNAVKMIHGRGKLADDAAKHCNDFIGTRLYFPGVGVVRAWAIEPQDYFKLGLRSLWLGLRRMVRLLLHWSRLMPLPKNQRPA